MPGRLKGEFVALRPLRVDDAAMTLAWRQSPRAGLLNAGAQTVEDQERWIASRPASDRDFIIETVAGTPLGMLSLVDIELVHRRAEYGRFLIGDEQAARGIPAAVEALRLLFDLAFDELRLERVYGCVVGTNRRMLKWQVYLGMREEARLRRHLWLGGRWHDAVVLGLLEPEYRAVTRNRMHALIAAGRPRQEAA